MNSLTRQLGLLSLTATGICSMVGASIYVVPFMVQRHVPGVTSFVWAAFLFAALPALMAAFAYAILSSAMPRAGGSYIYVSRGLHPYLGFVASFSQWFGLCVAIGAVSYVIIPFVRDVLVAVGAPHLANTIMAPKLRLALALALLWSFVWVNVRGVKAYEKTLLPLMGLMFVLGSVVIVLGLVYNQQDFVTALQQQNKSVALLPPSFDPRSFLAASAILFSSFIGFDSIAQAGGEAKEPHKLLPRAIALAVLVVGLFYFLFTSSVYHMVPWQFVASEAQKQDVTAPGLLSHIVPGWLTVWIVAGAAVALTNDLPAMLLSVSRLLFAWSADGIFPKRWAVVHPQYHTPQRAILLSGLVATGGIVGCYLAADFFMGVDVLVIAMLFNFLMMCVTVLTIHRVNPGLGAEVKIVRARWLQRTIAVLGISLISLFLVIHVQRDLAQQQPYWYFHSTYVWLVVMLMGSVIFWREYRQLKKNTDVKTLFQQLPNE
ncbi:MAG: APC family permease [Flammeovirgaceae bacterium]